jgi:hypothetical protein
MVDLPTALESVQRRLRGNPVPVHHTGKITAEVASMPLQLALAHQRMAPRLLLALELQPGEGRHQAHQPLDHPTTHPHQGDHTMTFRLHMVVLRLLQLQLQLQDTETKRQPQQLPKGQIKNHCGIIDLTHRHHDMTLPHQPQAHQRLLRMEVVMMHRRQPLELETAPGTLTVMRSKIGLVLRNCNHCPSISSFAASPNLAGKGPAWQWYLAAE